MKKVLGIIAACTVGLAPTSTGLADVDWHQVASEVVLGKRERPADETLTKEEQEKISREMTVVQTEYQQAHDAGYQDGLNGRERANQEGEVKESAYSRGFREGEAARQNQVNQVTQAPAQEQDQVAGETAPAEEHQPPVDSTSQEDEPPVGEGQDQGTTAVAQLPVNQTKLRALTTNQQAFLARLVPLAQRVGDKDDLYPSVLLAQAALESNWGQSDLATHYHNLFGVKGRGVTMPTTEIRTGKRQTELATFRRYQSDEEAFEDVGQVLAATRYAGVHRSKTSNYREATAALTGTYATDPDYGTKLNQLIEAYQLTDYDAGAVAPSMPTQLDWETGPTQETSDPAGAPARKPAHGQSGRRQGTVGRAKEKGHQHQATEDDRTHHGWVGPLVSSLGSFSLLELIKRRG